MFYLTFVMKRGSWHKTFQGGIPIDLICVELSVSFAHWILSTLYFSLEQNHLHDSPVAVYEDGTCSYMTPVEAVTYCNYDMTWYPFDRQVCEMKYGSWTYDSRGVRFVILEINRSRRCGLGSREADPGHKCWQCLALLGCDDVSRSCLQLRLHFVVTIFPLVVC